MNSIQKIHNEKSYKKIKFKITKTRHLLIRASINGILGNFILDTGASNSCVGFTDILKFNLTTSHSHTKASGAGASGIFTEISTQNNLKFGTWHLPNFDLIILDLSHVNEALQNHKTKPVNGIIGADVLIYANAIIDYENQYLYLKK